MGSFENRCCTYAPCAWDSAAGTCAPSTDTCTPEVVLGIPYCSYSVWQPGYHLGMSDSGNDPPDCWCHADEKGVNHVSGAGAVSRCVLSEDATGMVTPAEFNYGRVPSSCFYEGRGLSPLDMDQYRFVEVDTCTGLDAAQCGLAYEKWDHSICDTRPVRARRSSDWSAGAR